MVLSSEEKRRKNEGRALARRIFNEGKNMENQEGKLFFSRKFGVIRCFVYFCIR